MTPGLRHAGAQPAVTSVEVERSMLVEHKTLPDLPCARLSQT